MHYLGIGLVIAQLSLYHASQRQRLMTVIMKEVLLLLPGIMKEVSFCPHHWSTYIHTIRAGSRLAWQLISARDSDMQLYCHFSIHKVSEELFISITDKDKGRGILHSC